MKRENVLFLLMFVTILIVRLGVFFIPNVDVMVGEFIIHHFWFGILLMMIGWFVRKRYIGIVLFAMGLGLFIDEFVFMLFGAGGDVEYWGWFSVGCVGILIGFVFFLRGRIFYFMQKPFKGKIL